MSEDKTSPRPWKLDYVDEPLIAPAKPEASSSNGWRPIETAPKDGTEIVVHVNDYNREVRVVVSWKTLFGETASCWSDWRGCLVPQHMMAGWMLIPPGPGDTGRATNTGENSAPTQPRIED